MLVDGESSGTFVCRERGSGSVLHVCLLSPNCGEIGRRQMTEAPRLDAGSAEGQARGTEEPGGDGGRIGGP